MINSRNKHIDLSHINNLEDLDTEIIKIKRRIKSRELSIKEDFQQIPNEAVKASMGSIMPVFKKTQVADQAFTAIQTIVGGIVASVIAGKKNGGGFKRGLAETFKQVSFVGTVKAIFSLLAKNKKNKQPSKTTNFYNKSEVS